MTEGSPRQGRTLGTPTVHPDAWLASGALLVGDVTLDADASIWYGSVLRAEDAPITIGAGSNVQDNSVIHTDSGRPAVLGQRVTVGHAVVLHGCEIGDECLIGMGAIVMNGARIGARSLVAAGALVLEDTEIPPHSLVAGTPAKVRRELTADEVAKLQHNAEHYIALSEDHRCAEGHIVRG